MSIYENLITIANENAGDDISSGYPRTIIGALDAIADTLSGEDVDASDTISEAIRRLPIDGQSEGHTITVVDTGVDTYQSTYVDGVERSTERTIENVSGGAFVSVRFSSLLNCSIMVWRGETINTQPCDTWVGVGRVSFSMPPDTDVKVRVSRIA